jgi:hypothetical protein
MQPFRQNKVLGPGTGSESTRKGAERPKYVLPRNLVNPFQSLGKGLSAYAHPLSENLFSEYNFLFFSGQYFFKDGGAGNLRGGIFPALTIDAQQIGGKFKKLSRMEEDRSVGHHRPIQGALL